MLKNCSMKSYQKMNDIEEQEKLLYELYYASIFKKELKKFKKQPDKIQKILAVVKLLEKGGVSEIPKKMKLHMLIGQYQRCLECHIEGDLLLIWQQDDEEMVIVLERLGSHSELFQLIENSKFKTNNSKLNKI